jgi:hypothetical protein
MDATYSLTFAEPPADLLPQLRSVLAAQGSPPIRADQEADAFTFGGDTAEFMIKARAADALTTVWPGWQDAIRG